MAYLFKSRSRDHDHAPFSPFFNFSDQYALPAIRMQNFKFLPSAISEILGVPKFESMSRNLPLLTIFFVQHATRSILVQNLRFLPSAVSEILGGSQNLKVGHVTLATPLYSQFLQFFCLVSLNVTQRAKYEVSIFSRSRDIRGVPKFKKQVT